MSIDASSALSYLVSPGADAGMSALRRGPPSGCGQAEASKQGRRVRPQDPVPCPPGPLLELSPADRWKTRARRASGVLRGFKAQLDPPGPMDDHLRRRRVEAAWPTLGDFTADLPELVVALGDAAQRARVGCSYS